MPRETGNGRRGRKSPIKNTEWRDGILHFRARIRGKLHRWSLGYRHPLGASDVATAREAVAEGIKQLRAEAYGHSKSRVRYDDMMASWAETYILHQVGAKTAKRYASSLVQLDPWLRDLYFDEITRTKVGEIVQARRAAGVHNGSIRNDMTALSSVFKFAADGNDDDDGKDNPALYWWRKIKVRRSPIVLPNPAHVERVLKRCPPGLRAIAKAAQLTGVRQDALVHAEIGNLDHARRQLTLIGKGNRLQVIDLNYNGAYEFLAGLPKALGCKWLFWHPEPLRDRVTRRPIKGQYTSEPFRNVSSNFSGIVRDEMAAARALAKKAGHIEPDFRLFRFHDLRHLFAVDWLKAGRSIYDLQHRLNHRSIKTTEIYLEYLTEDERHSVMYGPQTTQPPPANVRPIRGN